MVPQCYALGRGNIKLNTSHGIFVLKSVLFVPSQVADLLSITRVMNIGTDVHFISKQQKVYFTQNNKVICTASPKGGLVILDEDAPHTAFAASKHVHPETYAWHRKLGHLGFDNLAKLARKGFFAPGGPEPADFLQAKESAPCEACIEAKYLRHSHPSSSKKQEAPIGRLHTDVHFISNHSVTGHIGFVSFTEDRTDFALTTLIKRKTEGGQALVNAVAFYENQYKEKGYRVQRIRSDNGGEYTSAFVDDFCVQKGIIQEYPNPGHEGTHALDELHFRIHRESAGSHGLKLNIIECSKFVYVVLLMNANA